MSGTTAIDILFIICEPRAAHPLTDEIMDRLIEWKIPARVLKYGIMQKSLHGFIVVAVQGLPSNLLEIIKRDGEVSGYVVLEEDDAPATTVGTEVQV